MFTNTRRSRDLACQGKDAVILPILQCIKIANPGAFKALLMPAMYGPEAYHLISRGVPPANIYAIEQDPATHAEIMACRRKDREQLKGIGTTAYPMPAHQAIHRAKAHAAKYHLIYLDFFGQPEYSTHYKHIITTIFALGMLAANSTFVLNFGRIRSRKDTARLNKQLLAIEQRGNKTEEGLPTNLMVRAAIRETGYRSPVSVEDINYRSTIAGRKHQYITTVTTFSADTRDHPQAAKPASQAARQQKQQHDAPTPER
jgi:hypothetical protein